MVFLFLLLGLPLSIHCLWKVLDKFKFDRNYGCISIPGPPEDYILRRVDRTGFIPPHDWILEERARV